MTLERRLDKNKFKDTHFKLVDEDGQYIATFQLSDLSADRLYTFPNLSGTITTDNGTVYLMLSGGTMAGNINMDDNDIEDVDRIAAATVDVSATCYMKRVLAGGVR